MPDITITLTDTQAKGIKYVMDRANEQIVLENEAIRARNDTALAADPSAGVEVEKPLHTPKTYVQFVMRSAADSYLETAASEMARERAEKLAALDSTKLAQVDAILA